MRYLLYFGLLLTFVIACQNEETYDKSLIPETTTLDVTKDIDIKEHLGLTDEQKEVWNDIDLTYAEKHIVNLENKDNAEKTETYQKINAEYERELYDLLDKEQKERFLDYKAYEVVRRKKKSVKSLDDLKK